MECRGPDILLIHDAGALEVEVTFVEPRQGVGLTVVVGKESLGRRGRRQPSSPRW